MEKGGFNKGEKKGGLHRRVYTPKLLTLPLRGVKGGRLKMSGYIYDLIMTQQQKKKKDKLAKIK